MTAGAICLFTASAHRANEWRLRDGVHPPRYDDDGGPKDAQSPFLTERARSQNTRQQHGSKKTGGEGGGGGGCAHAGTYQHVRKVLFGSVKYPQPHGDAKRIAETRVPSGRRVRLEAAVRLARNGVLPRRASCHVALSFRAAAGCVCARADRARRGGGAG
ncbi:hypothetical protein FGB62_33g171 [Gracilaria domingensis]|nr:hypothetical protein FGB62_33g171 [Gracilaria domingensis]